MKDIPNYKGIYSITEDGEVWSYKRKKFLKPYKHKKECNYLKVSLCNNGIEKQFFIHDLVALTYIPNPLNKPTVDHIDRNPLNNHVTNLRWASHKEQCQNKEYKNYNRGFCIKKPVNMCDINTHQVINRFDSIAEAEKYLGKKQGQTNIGLVCKKLRNHACGYYWEYA